VAGFFPPWPSGQVESWTIDFHLAPALVMNTAPYTGRFIMFSVITNIYNKKTKGPTLMELSTATGKLKKFFFDN
jgi:hypothetical protein